MSMQFYADIIQKEQNGSERIELFCECVDILNLKGHDIKKFARMCGFGLVAVADRFNR